MGEVGEVETALDEVEEAEGLDVVREEVEDLGVAMVPPLVVVVETLEEVDTMIDLLTGTLLRST